MRMLLFWLSLKLIYLITMLSLHTEVPMLKVDDEQKLKAMHTIEHIHVRGRTNLGSAMSLAAQVANGVKVRPFA